MTTSIDSNVLISLWSKHLPTSQAAFERLKKAAQSGPMLVCAPVYAELLAQPDRDEKLILEFFHSTGISVDWEISRNVWVEGGYAYRHYAHRRKKSASTIPRRILADFLIGAHALVHGYTLLTFDTRLYRAAFPKLKLMS